jgi:formate hydrogenlyase transcriptional activator
MVQQTLDGMIAVGIGCNMTKRIVRSDGKLRVIRYIGVPVFENDIVTRFIGTLTEITEQETADLRLSQAYREQAEALSHTGSFGWNLSSRELVCSDETLPILKDA